MRLKVYNNRLKVYGGRVKYNYPNESKAVVDAIQTTDQLNAIQRLYGHFIIGMEINEGVWTLNKALWLMLGGTAEAHKWNAKDPRDLDTAFRLTFPNGMTHDTFGITGNGTDQYARTFLTPSSTAGITTSSNNLSAYVTKNVGDGIARYVFGAGTYTSSNILAMFIRKTTIQAYLSSNSTAIDAKVYTNNITDLIGYYQGNNLSNVLSIRKDGLELSNNTSNLSDGLNGLPTFDITIMARQVISGSFGDFDNKSLGFAKISEGLTVTQLQQEAQIINFAQKMRANF